MTVVNGWLIEAFPHTMREEKVVAWTTVLRKDGRVVNLAGSSASMQQAIDASIAWAKQN